MNKEIESYSKTRKSSVEKLRMLEKENTFDLPGGGKGIFDPKNTVSAYELYQRGYDVIFTGKMLFFKPEYANKKTTMKIFKRLESEETSVRKKMAKEDPDKYDNPEFLREGSIKLGYENFPAEGGGNSNPWHFSKDFTYIAQPGGKIRSQIPPKKIHEIIMNSLLSV